MMGDYLRRIILAILVVITAYFIFKTVMPDPSEWKEESTAVKSPFAFDRRKLGHYSWYENKKERASLHDSRLPGKTNRH